MKHFGVVAELWYCNLNVDNVMQFFHRESLHSKQLENSITNPTNWLHLLSEFDPFSQVWFGKCRRAVRLFYFIPIHVWRKTRVTPGGGCWCTCSISPKNTEVWGLFQQFLRLEAGRMTVFMCICGTEQYILVLKTSKIEIDSKKCTNLIFRKKEAMSSEHRHHRHVEWRVHV